MDFGEMNRRITEEFRANGGESAQFPAGSLLILHTTGARSGEERLNPLMHIRHGDDMVVAASKGGAPTNPDWYRNVQAHPEVTVEHGTESFRGTARVAGGEERDELYAALASQYPQFADYERKTDRVIPIVVLTRAA